MVAASSMALEIEEITNPHPQCKLCTLAARNPNVVLVVHELYRRGVSGRTLIQKLEPVFAEANEELPARPSLERHLTKHCAILKGAPQVAPPKGTSDHETDYFELRTLYHEFKVIFQDVRREFSEAKRQKKKTSDYGLVMLVKLASELRQMLKTLSDMRNSEKLVSIILARHTEQLVHLLTEPLGATLRDVRDRLWRGEDPRVVAEKLDDLLGGELLPLFETIANQALEQSRQQYKLH